MLARVPYCIGAAAAAQRGNGTEGRLAALLQRNGTDGLASGQLDQVLSGRWLPSHFRYFKEFYPLLP